MTERIPARGRHTSSLRMRGDLLVLPQMLLFGSGMPKVKRTNSPMSFYEEPLFLLTNLEPSTGYSFLDLHDLRGWGWGIRNLGRFRIPLRQEHQSVPPVDEGQLSLSSPPYLGG